jgi:drug/metabolite transporter (DMT)-like permease
LLGGLLALVSAATFALNNATTRRGVLTGTVMQALAITVPLGVPLFFIVAAITGQLGAISAFSPLALLWLALAGIVHFVLGRYCNYRSTAAVGANLSGPVQQAELIVTLVLAVWLLGEVLTPLRALGIALVIVGPALMLAPELRRRSAGSAVGTATVTPAGPDTLKYGRFEPRYAEGVTFALLAALGYGTSPIFVRAALESAGLGASLAAGLVSYTAAALVIGLMMLSPSRLAHVLDVKREPATWFTWAGVLVCISQMFRYAALALAPASVVAPIQRVSSIFRVLFSSIMNREHEVLDERVILATAISLSGALMLSVSTEAVLAVLPLPEWLAAIVRWQWP